MSLYFFTFFLSLPFLNESHEEFNSEMKRQSEEDDDENNDNLW